MIAALVLCHLALSAQPAAATSPPPAQESLDAGGRAYAVPGFQAGLKGACVGGLCGTCLGFGVPGACVGGLLGWYLDEVRQDGNARDEHLEMEREKRDEEKAAAQKAAQAKCEEARSGAPEGSPGRKLDCSPESGPGRPFLQLGLAAGGTLAAGLVLVVGVVLAAGAAGGGTFVWLSGGAPAAALIGVAVGLGAVMVGLVVANILAGALWVPFGVWFLRDLVSG